MLPFMKNANLNVVKSKKCTEVFKSARKNQKNIKKNGDFCFGQN